MSQTDKAEFDIVVSVEGATREELDRLTRQLLSRLRELNVESAALARAGAAPVGSKGDPVTIGAIAVSAIPTVIPAVIALVQAWSARGPGRTVKFKGRGIEFEGSPEELHNLLVSLAGEPLPSRTHSAREAVPPAELDPPHSGAQALLSPGIFISYRRADSADMTGRIYDRLTGHFGRSAVFKDVDSIPPGMDFREHLEKAVGQCRVFLIVIGDRWLEMVNSLQENRLHDPGDFVRIELEAALGRNIPIIPLLVHGASMPVEEKLPSSLQRLSYRQAIPIRPDPDFHRDMDRLIAAISAYSGTESWPA